MVVGSIVTLLLFSTMFVKMLFKNVRPHIVGTIEFITLIRGTLEIVAGEQTFTIRPGESIRFPGDTVHSYRNLDPDSTALHLIMYTP